MFNVHLTIYSVILINIVHSAKILAVYPIPCISHQLYFRTLTMELLKRGHELTVLTTDPAFSNDTAPNNIREIDLHDISYKNWQNILEMPMGNSDDHSMQHHVGYEIASDMFEKQLKTDAVKNLLGNKESFDLLLYDGCLEISIIFTYVYKVPAVGVYSLGATPGSYETIGAVINEAYYPSNIGITTAKNYIENLQEVYKYQNHLLYIEEMQTKAFKNAFGDHMSDFKSLKKNIVMMFINLYNAWDSYRPAPISLKYSGGLHSVPEKPLPEDMKSYLESSPNGVIYMSLGTNVKSSKLPHEKVKIFTKVFSQLPYDVLWKWDFDTIINKPKNVRLFKWLPQSDVLKHPKIKLFITQGGHQSTDEAITAGVPLIGIPMLFDQWFITDKCVRYNFGLQLDFGALTEDSLRNAIDSIIGNQSYYSNIVQHRSLMHDRPQKPLYDAVHWIEYIIKHGGYHLQAPAADISWAEYLELELLLTMIVVMGSVIVGLIYGLHFVFFVMGQSVNLKIIRQS